AGGPEGHVVVEDRPGEDAVGGVRVVGYRLQPGVPELGVVEVDGARVGAGRPVGGAGVGAALDDERVEPAGAAVEHTREPTAGGDDERVAVVRRAAEALGPGEAEEPRAAQVAGARAGEVPGRVAGGADQGVRAGAAVE